MPLTDVTINGQNYSRVFGGSVPAPIWAEFMTYVHRDLPINEFAAEPENIRKYLFPPATTVPSVVGFELDEAEEKLREAKLNITIEEVASLEPAGFVVAQSHEAGSSIGQGTFIIVQVSTGETPTGVLPSFTGLTVAQAIVVIREFETTTGVKVSIFEQRTPTSDPDLVGKIVSTNPPAGTVIEGSGQVIFFVGDPPGS